MTGDTAQLFRWKPGDGASWIDLGEGSFRPSLIQADFIVGELSVSVVAVGDEHGVKITGISRFQPLADYGNIQLPDTGEMNDLAKLGALASKLRWLEAKATSPIRAEDMSRFNPETAAETLAVMAVVDYFFDSEGRPEQLRIGASGPFLEVADVRRYLAGPGGPSKSGPKPKASPEQVAKTWKAATKKGLPVAQAVADSFDVSIATANRWIGRARKAGLIEERV